MDDRVDLVERVAPYEAHTVAVHDRPCRLLLLCWTAEQRALHGLLIPGPDDHWLRDRADSYRRDADALRAEGDTAWAVTYETIATELRKAAADMADGVAC